MKHGWFEAAEDEIALTKLCGLSPYISFMFPDNAATYEKYIDFLECTDEERTRWKERSYFIKKIMLDTGGKRASKSCMHAARIRLLLEMFPDAKFVHIHRNLYEVFGSTPTCAGTPTGRTSSTCPKSTGRATSAASRPPSATASSSACSRTRSSRKRTTLSPYADLIGNELEVVDQIYRKFELPDREQYLASIAEYLDSIKGYKRNKLEIDDEFKDYVYDRWRLCFDAYGYPKEYDA